MRHFHILQFYLSDIAIKKGLYTSPIKQTVNRMTNVRILFAAVFLTAVIVGAGCVLAFSPQGDAKENYPDPNISAGFGDGFSMNTEQYITVDSAQKTITTTFSVTEVSESVTELNVTFVEDGKQYTTKVVNTKLSNTKYSIYFPLFEETRFVEYGSSGWIWNSESTPIAYGEGANMMDILVQYEINMFNQFGSSTLIITPAKLFSAESGKDIMKLVLLNYKFSSVSLDQKALSNDGGARSPVAIDDGYNIIRSTDESIFKTSLITQGRQYHVNTISINDKDCKVYERDTLTDAQTTDIRYIDYDSYLLLGSTFISYDDDGNKTASETLKVLSVNYSD